MGQRYHRLPGKVNADRVNSASFGFIDAPPPWARSLRLNAYNARRAPYNKNRSGTLEGQNMPYAGLDLTGRKALVTGAARGIGATLAVGLAQAGAEVAICDLPTEAARAGLSDTAGRIRAEGGAGFAYDLDVREVASIDGVIRQAASDLGGLDILVNNAGIRRRAPALAVTEADWDAVLDTNLKGAFFCAQAAARLMIPQQFGRIIGISSQLAIVGAEHRAAYCASKAGLANLTRVLALEWAQYGITVNAIGPGPTTTPGLLEADAREADAVQAELSVKMPLGRRLDAEELTGAAIYLASDSARATTGHLLVVDGGWTAL